MSTPEDRLAQLGLALPAPLQLPPGVTLPFPWVRIVGNRAIISGHGPTNTDGSLAQPLGKVGLEVNEEQAYVAARLTGMAILGSLKRELGSLSRIACWTRIFGMVNSAPGFTRQPAVINGFTDLIVSVFGQEQGAHARSAVGLAELPFRIPVEIEGEVELRPSDAQPLGRGEAQRQATRPGLVVRGTFSPARAWRPAVGPASPRTLGLTKSMDTLPAYDPEIQPNAEAWLELDEQERISLAERFHKRANIDLPDVKAHAVFHAIVENQFALGLECAVRAIPRLMKQGLSRHDAVHAIASVLADHLYEQANAKSEDTAEVVQARYDSAVERLTAKEWLAKYGAQ